MDITLTLTREQYHLMMETLELFYEAEKNTDYAANVKKLMVNLAEQRYVERYR